MPTRRLSLPILLVVSALACAACKKEAPQAPAAGAPSAATAAAPATTPAAPSTAAAAPAAADRVFSAEELAQMVAPIALYPDPLLAQVLMAATYPGDVADAAAWSKANPKATGDAAVRQVADQPWDPSVQALAAFPQVLATLGQDPGWVQRLGDAFLAQPDDVMDAVQVLRHKAQDAGNLANNEYQKISTQPAPARVASAPPPEAAAQYDDSAAGAYSAPPQQTYTDTIVIQPSDPQVVYVPSYNPTTAYGTWAYPSYPPPYYPPPSYYYPAGGALMRGLAWGTGVAIADSLWGDCDWNGGDIDINVSSYNSINTNRQISSNANRWEHNSLNRDGVPYRDQRSRDQYSNRLADSGSRDRMRGDDPARAQQREQARQSMQGRGIEAPARTNREAQDRAQRAQRDIAQERDRNAQRERAQAASQDRQRQAGQQRDRERAQQQQRDRTQQQQRDRANQQRSAQQRQQASQHRQQGANNRTSQDRARQQAQRQQRPHNDAFSGAQRPQQSRQQAQRGHSSQNAARQGGGRQQASHQVNRQPQRSGGGQRSGGAQRSGGGHRR